MTAFARWYFVEAGWVWFVIVSAAFIAAWCVFDIWREDRKHREALIHTATKNVLNGMARSMHLEPIEEVAGSKRGRHVEA